MSSKTAILGLLILLMLGQAALAGADIHILFEDAEHSHHQDSNSPVDAEEFTLADDCGHCCYSHGSTVGLVQQPESLSGVSKSFLSSQYLNAYLSPVLDPSLRPPIA